ncbi:selenocysteine insertion sequence-binding protein 2-like, partial [Mizuhopecten yessoensis]|uniref:selenocysteine insertion sequence-binding protein 2-like n=1 Tax=Mizuhopecten yessoensis TaxID=6573 RepID=UPI000B45C60D
MIDALEKKKDVPVPKKKEVSVSVEPKVKKSTDQKGVRPHNMLDSSAPMLKRGKERENPKPKKPSPLKKVILKEREEKKKLRLLDDSVPGNPGVPMGIGVISAESDLSQDAYSFKGSADYGVTTPASNDLSPISQTSPISMSPLSPGASPLSSEVNSPIAGTIGKEAVLKIHSRRFREYCNQVLNKDIDSCCTALLQDLVRFQDRVYHKEPNKAKSKRRLVLGLREVTKHLKLKKIKCVIISPNLEKIQSK